MKKKKKTVKKVVKVKKITPSMVLLPSKVKRENRKGESNA